MRPIKLKMTAFGPYSGEEIIDFRELENRKLFLITGSTGSGKTTIFDAISFAMYGETSGNIRSGESLRSHYALDSTLTEVELEFELKNNTYILKRIPKQLKPKKRGEGFTEQKSDAELLCVSTNKIYTSVTDVNEKIESLVGINADQFRQIMMIPQGEFRKLLTSDSQEREKILQKLFDTSLYNKVQMSLDFKSKKLWNHIKGKIELRNHEVEKILCEPDSELNSQIIDENKNINRILELTKEQIEIDISNNKILLVESETISLKIENNITKREKSKTINENIEKLNLLKTELINIELNKNAMIDLNNLTTKSESALLVRTYEDLYKNSQKKTIETEEKMNAIKKDLINVETKKMKLELEFNIINSDENNKVIKSLYEEILNLNRFKEKVSKISEIEKTIEIAENEKKDFANFFKKNENELILINSKVLVLKENLEKSRKAGLEINEIIIDLSKLEYTFKGLVKLNDLLFEKSDLIKKLENKNNKFEIINLKYNEEQNFYSTKKINFLLNQAAILAKGLESNKQCPVCGSLNHPNLAEFTEEVITEFELNILEKKVDEIRNSKALIEKDILIFKENVKAIDDNITLISKEISLMDLSIEKSIGITEGKISDLKEKQKILLKIISDQDTIVNDLDNQDKNINSLTKEREKTIEKCNVINITIESEKKLLLSIFEEIPLEINNLNLLENKIKQVSFKYTSLTQNIENKSKELQNVKDRSIEVETKNITINRQLLNLKNDFDVNYKLLKESLVANDFESFENYLIFKDEIKNIKSNKNILNTYNNKLIYLKEKVNDLKNLTKDKSKIDMSNIKDEIDNNRIQLSEVNMKKGDILLRLKSNEKSYSEVESISNSILKYEKDYSVIGNLSKVANGNNKARITFERYVLAAFLNDILIAANLRLSKMTNGRYILNRTEELERKNKQSGLELEVYDNYTGKSRHVKTLSGGEGFKASLSMALGLSDVVQSYSGGVQLDTMFIDEGFGTLDQESLDSAINCLIDLQKTGRLVGIISHVQELKERIDTRLEVTSSTKGSKTEFIV